MNAGTQTGSLVNHLYSRMTIGEPEPTVGMGVTMLSWTDRDAGTIVEVNMKKRYIAVTEDNKKRIDNNGISESQEYEYTTVMDGHRRYYRKDKKGQMALLLSQPKRTIDLWHWWLVNWASRVILRLFILRRQHEQNRNATVLKD